MSENITTESSKLELIYVANYGPRGVHWYQSENEQDTLLNPRMFTCAWCRRTTAIPFGALSKDWKLRRYHAQGCKNQLMADLGM